MNVKGYFITLEGGEGAGKTSAIQYISSQLMALGYDVLTTREPGGIQIAEQIREVILDRNNTEMEGRTEALLYAAARRQHLIEKVLPALEAGQIVLCDRFIDSSLAYQGYARQIGVDDVYAINEFAIDGKMPDLTLFFDVPPEIGLKRIQTRHEQNRLDLEAQDFHYKVYEGYQMLVQKYKDRIRSIDATKSKDEVFENALQFILKEIKKEDESK